MFYQNFFFSPLKPWIWKKSYSQTSLLPKNLNSKIFFGSLQEIIWVIVAYNHTKLSVTWKQLL